MRFIKKVNLVQDLDGVPNEVKKSALAWLAVIENKETIWRNFVDVRNTYATASPVSGLCVFDIKSHRLIVGINFGRQVVYYKTILSHSEYEKGHWKAKYCR